MSHELGFESLERETRTDALPTDGTIPSWLSGTLVRTGPAKFEVGEDAYNHWFDGLAMLHAFRFDEGDVAYANRFVQSGSYEDAREADEIVRGEFGTDPCRSLFKRAKQVLFPADLTDNANINVEKLADAYVSMTETPIPIVFDDETLETRDHFEFDDDLEGDITTAHPHRDRDRDAIYNYLTAFGWTSTYRIYRQPVESRSRRLVTEIDVSQPRYMHSFGATRRYVVLVEFPVVMYPLRLLFGNTSFAEHMSWEPERGTRLRIVDKESGEVVGTGTCDPFFAFHHVNAFEEDGELVLDLVTYPDLSIVEQLYLDRLRDETSELVAGRFERLRTTPEAEDIRRERLYDAHLELPRIHPQREGRRHRHVWAGCQSDSASFIDRLAHLDLQTRELEQWHEPACFPGEPVFVPRPDAESEDDGVVLSVVLDAEASRSRLVILDAANLREIGRAEVPHPIPFGFHGQYFDA